MNNIPLKSKVNIEVKLYEGDNIEALETIAKKVKSEIKYDGLVWVDEHKFIEIAYGFKKI
jgi:translation elongation factor EF-1beta